MIVITFFSDDILAKQCTIDNWKNAIYSKPGVSVYEKSLRIKLHINTQL